MKIYFQTGVFCEGVYSITEEFSRLEMLIGDKAMGRLSASHVAVFGMGGVGGWAAEALVRCGVGEITVVDHDRVSRSNINRQIFALSDTVGLLKTDVAAMRFKQINTEIILHKKSVFFNEETAADFDFVKFDYVIDAIDTVSSKLLLIKLCVEKNVPVISSMGAGNKLNPTKFQVADIYETSVCPLARVMRRELRRLGVGELKTVYSTELPLKPMVEIEHGERSVPGSAAFVPPVAGLIIASEVVRGMCELKQTDKI